MLPTDQPELVNAAAELVSCSMPPISLKSHRNIRSFAAQKIGQVAGWLVSFAFYLGRTQFVKQTIWQLGLQVSSSASNGSEVQSLNWPLDDLKVGLTLERQTSRWRSGSCVCTNSTINSARPSTEKVALDEHPMADQLSFSKIWST